MIRQTVAEKQFIINANPVTEISTFSFPFGEPPLPSAAGHLYGKTPSSSCLHFSPVKYLCLDFRYCFKLCEIKFINFSRSSLMSLLPSWLYSSFLMQKLWQNSTFVDFFLPSQQSLFHPRSNIILPIWGGFCWQRYNVKMVKVERHNVNEMCTFCWRSLFDWWVLSKWSSLGCGIHGCNLL